jgi:serine/threonine-protein kinase
MEFVDGNTLADILRKQKQFNPTVAANVCVEVASALAFAHRNGVVHRDVKPANILIGNNGAIKVADFGIARAIDSGHEEGLTQDGAVMGTATYFSPEQAMGESPDPRSDLYSLGIVLYELVAGKPPFTGESAVATAFKQVHEMPEPLRRIVADIPRPFEAIVAKCLAKYPENRYATAEELRDDLRRFREGLPVYAMMQAQGRATDQPTTVMQSMPSDPNATSVLPRTSVMPAQQTPTPESAAATPGVEELDLPEYEEVGGRNRGYIFGAIAVVGVLLAGAVFLAVSLMGGSGLTVPNVLNMTLADATKVLQDKGLVVTNTATAKDGADDNVVFDESPAAGSSIKKGETVNLTYNPPKPPVTVPPLQGLTFQEALAQLTPLGLQLTVSGTQTDPTRAAGQIISQDPAGSQTLAAGGTVKVVVSGGAGQVIVPNVSGQTSAAAQTLLQGAPYNLVVTVLQEPSATMPSGSVTRTDPAIGLPVDSGSKVNLYVSSGSAQVSVPSVQGLSEADARAALTKVGLTADVQYADVVTGSAQVGKVISQGTAANTMIPSSQHVVLTVGRASATATTVAGG